MANEGGGMMGSSQQSTTWTTGVKPDKATGKLWWDGGDRFLRGPHQNGRKLLSDKRGHFRPFLLIPLPTKKLEKA